MPLTRNPRIVSQTLFDEQSAVLLHLDTSAYHSVNEVGAFIWDLLTQPVDPDRIVERVRERFPDAPATTDADVRDFLARLAERDLIVSEAEAAADHLVEEGG